MVPCPPHPSFNNQVPEKLAVLQAELDIKAQQIRNMEQQIETSNSLNAILKSQVQRHKEKATRIQATEMKVIQLEKRCKELETQIKVTSPSELSMLNDPLLPVLENAALDCLMGMNEEGFNSKSKRRKLSSSNLLEASLARVPSSRGVLLGKKGTKKSPKAGRRRSTPTKSAAPSVFTPASMASDALRIMESQFDAQTNDRPQTNPCNCKKSRCLKLYCDCFASRQYCHECNCVDCHNLPGSVSRIEAIHVILSRRPDAFNPKIDDETVAIQEAKVDKNSAMHNKGCNCKKSHCLKKYCECYQLNAYCGANCKCVDCQNYEGSISCPKFFQSKLLSLLANQSQNESSIKNPGSASVTEVKPLSPVVLSDPTLISNAQKAEHPSPANTPVLAANNPVFSSAVGSTGVLPDIQQTGPLPSNAPPVTLSVPLVPHVDPNKNAVLSQPMEIDSLVKLEDSL